MDNLESPEGIFAIIDDDSQEVVMLYYYEAEGDLKRISGKWDFLSVNDDELLEGGIQVPVEDGFVPLFDSAEKSGKVLTNADVERFKIKLEQ